MDSTLHEPTIPYYQKLEGLYSGLCGHEPMKHTYVEDPLQGLF